MSTYTEYTQHLTATNTPFIGMLAWYGVSDTARVMVQDLLKKVNETDAPIKVPQVAKPADVFRRATKQAQRNKVPTGKPGTFYNFLIRDVGYDDEYVRRHLVAEQVDAKHRDLEYEILSRITFEKATRKLEFNDSSETDLATLETVAEIKNFISKFIEDNSLTVATVVLRSIIRTCLETTLLGTSVRQGGGVYFIKMDFAEQLEAAWHVCNSFDGVSLHMLPLVDDEKQRTMVRESFISESTGAANHLISDINDLLKMNGPVTAKKYTEISVRYTELKDKLDQYSDILEDNLGVARSSIEVAGKQMKALLNK